MSSEDRQTVQDISAIQEWLFLQQRRGNVGWCRDIVQDLKSIIFAPPHTQLHLKSVAAKVGVVDRSYQRENIANAAHAANTANTTAVSSPPCAPAACSPATPADAATKRGARPPLMRPIYRPAVTPSSPNPPQPTPDAIDAVDAADEERMVQKNKKGSKSSDVKIRRIFGWPVIYVQLGQHRTGLRNKFQTQGLEQSHRDVFFLSFFFLSLFL